MNQLRTSVLVIFVGRVLAPGLASATVEYTVTDLGSLGVESSPVVSEGLGINDSGQVTGVSETANFAQAAFLYSGGSMIDLGTLGGSNSYGQSINAKGQVTGSAETAGDNSYDAFLYSSGTMTDLGTLGGTGSTGYGINGSAQVTGSSYTPSGDEHAFLYSSGTMTDLGTLGGGTSQGYGINDSARVTGMSYTASGTYHAFLYSGGTMTDLGSLDGPAFNSSGLAINNSGQVTGASGTPSGAGHAFLYSGGSMTDLGTLGGLNSVGSSINNGGQVTGNSNTASGAHEAFLYSNGSMVDLNSLIDPSSGWNLFQGSAINDAGQITGLGTLNGETHAFLLTPIPPAPISTSSTSVTSGALVHVPFGGSQSAVGGGEAAFVLHTDGVFTSSYFDVNSPTQLQAQLGVVPPAGVNFFLSSPSQTTQMWELHDSGTFAGSVTVTLHYDPTLIGNINPSQLQIWHLTDGVWVATPTKAIDPVADTITFTTNSFSPFVLGVAVPEPGTGVLAVMGLLGLVLARRRARSRQQSQTSKSR